MSAETSKCQSPEKTIRQALDAFRWACGTPAEIEGTMPNADPPSRDNNRGYSGCLDMAMGKAKADSSCRSSSPYSYPVRESRVRSLRTGLKSLSTLSRRRGRVAGCSSVLVFRSRPCSCRIPYNPEAVTPSGPKANKPWNLKPKKLES